MPGIPDQGSIGYLNFDPQVGREQSGRRPCLVLSPARYNSRVGLALVCPITRQEKGYPFELALPKHGQITGVVLCDQLRSLDWRGRDYTDVESVSQEFVSEVLARVKPLLFSE